MNERQRWEQTLVKKFSSSNHFKLLNQLKNEVKKYPLIKKKNLITNLSLDNKYDSKSKAAILNPQNDNVTNNSKNNKDNYTNQSKISFNNSKNFSIYNNSNDSTKDQKDNSLSEDKNSDQEQISSFKERLNQIDMK